MTKFGIGLYHMKNDAHRKLKRWSIIGVFVIFAIAGLWHFLYVWLPSPLTAVLSPVNESPWEHAKLFFMPALIYFSIGCLTAGRTYPNFLFAHAAVMPLMPMLMLGIYYLLCAVCIESFPLDLVNTLIVIALGVFASFKLTVASKRMDGPGYRAAAVMIVLGLLTVFAVLTYLPPHISIFQDSKSFFFGLPLK